MYLTNFSKLKLLEWLDDFLRDRIKILSKCKHQKGEIVKSYDKNCKCIEIIKLYEGQVQWNKGQRIKLAKMVLKESAIL